MASAKKRRVEFDNHDSSSTESGLDAPRKKTKIAKPPPNTDRSHIVPSQRKSEPAEGSNENVEAKAISPDMTQSKTFHDLGIIDPLCEACEQLGFKTPTPIQVESIPLALQGRDVIGLAETGSGKTAAFALPILQALIDAPVRSQANFALVLAPTRELAQQSADQFKALGSQINVKTCLITGGEDKNDQQVQLALKPHIIVATLGRLIDIIETTKGLSFRTLKYLVIDEADRLLDLDFEKEMTKLLNILPREGRRSYLFSATMSNKVESLQRASLTNPVRVSVKNRDNAKYQTVSTLLQSYVFIPQKHKDHYLIAILSRPFAGQSTIVFARTAVEVQRLTFFLRALGLKAVPIYGKLAQNDRVRALAKFKSQGQDILVATDVAARGLDIPRVALVLNYDLPGDSATYVHRVGRTARAGKSGHAISLVTQYDIEVLLRIEHALGDKKLPEYKEILKDEAMVFAERVSEAQRRATRELKSEQEKRDKKHRGRKRHGGGRDEMDKDEG